jgi:hypothetical protein
LSRIEERSFGETGLIEMVIPASVQSLSETYFVERETLPSLIFEAGSRLTRIEKQTLLFRFR